MADGTITIDSKLETKKLEADLKLQEKELAGINRQLDEQWKKYVALEAKMKAMTDEARKISEAMGTELTEEDMAQAFPEFQQINSEMLEMSSQIQDTQQQQANVTSEIAKTKEEIGKMREEYEKVPKSGKDLKKQMNGVNKTFSKFNKRIASLASGVLVFSLITKALRAFVEWFGKVIKTNKEATAAIAKLKGALLTLVQPIVEVILPAFTKFVNVLAKIASAVAGVISSLFGKTAAQSSASAAALYEQTEALEGVGGAAKDASKQMASFDEINQISNTDTSSGGGGASSTIAPEFNDDGITEDLRVIEALVLSIAAGLAAWKIVSSFTDNMKTIGGLALSIAGAVALVYFWLDAWNNGVDWTNLIGMVVGLAALAGGLAIAFGSVGAGIALVVGGIALLVVGIKDVIQNGFNLQNTLLAVAGILALGLGISLLTGSWIPMLIAGIAAVVVALVSATGNGELLINGFKTLLQGFIDFFAGIFTGDWDRAVQGACQIFTGLGDVIFAVLNSLETVFLSFFDWLDEKTGGKLTGIITTIKNLFSGTFSSIKEALSGVITFLTGVFTGDWQKAWDGVKQIFKGVVNYLITILETGVNYTINCVNGFFSLINKAIVGIGDLIGADWKGIPAIEPISIPRLAEGAVLPGGREFLAVLGDQPRGQTNIEAPLETIKQALAEVLAGGFVGGGEQTVILQLDRQTLGKVVYKLNRDETRRIGVSLAGV